MSMSVQNGDHTECNTLLKSVQLRSQFWKGNSQGNQARNESLRSVKYLGRTLWKKWSGYHRRSLVETRMYCFKLLANRVKSRDFDR